MIPLAEYEQMVAELLALESQLETMGKIEVDTSEGPYALHERALFGHGPQDEYNRLYDLCKTKRRMVEAIDLVNRHKLAMSMA